MVYHILILIIVGALGILFYRKWTKQPLLLPKPPGLPILGNIFQLDDSGPHKTLTEWSKKYGPVYAMNLFGKDIVVLSSYEAIHEAAVRKGNAFSGRPKSFLFETAYGESGPDKQGLAGMDFGKTWQHQRKAFRMALNVHGDGRKKLEESYMNLLGEFIETLKAKSGESFSLKDSIANLITCSMHALAYGEDVKLDDQRLILNVAWIRKMMDSLNVAGPLEIMPWLRFFGNKIYKDLVQASQDRDDLFKGQFTRAKKSVQVDTPVGFLQNIISYQTKHTVSGSQPFTDANINSIMTDFFNGGVDTSTSVLSSFVLVMLNHPDIQSKIQQEIDSSVGHERMPTIADREHMPYTVAAIMEVQRYASIASTGVFRNTTQSTEVMSLAIPKDTQVWFNLWALHHDSYWNEPWSVKPERFLEGNGNVVPVDHPHRRRLMPFSAGRRACPGEVLAKERIFLTVCTLLQNFTLLPADGVDQPPSSDPREYECGLSLMPKDFQIKLLTR